MAAKVACVLVVYCLLYFFIKVDCSIVKPNNIPRIGRSDESAGSYDQDSLGYVIKTNKNIPRMGRRNYDSINRFDIPKLYALPGENFAQYADQDEFSFGERDRFENMKRK